LHHTPYAECVTDSNWEQPGEPIYVIGSPRGLGLTITNGMLSGWRSAGAMMQFSAPIDHGSSGSPVFNAYGQVIGIVDSGTLTGAELNFAISTNAIFEALGTTNTDHPQGFKTGITIGLELRSQEDVNFDGLSQGAIQVGPDPLVRLGAVYKVIYTDYAGKTQQATALIKGSYSELEPVKDGRFLPSNAENGDCWFDTDRNQFFIAEDHDWYAVSSSATTAGDEPII